MVRLPGAPRHLQLAGPAGPVLVPAEQVGRLYQVALPSGKVVADTRVGRQPHDAAAAGPVVFVGNEYSNTVSLVRGGRQVAVEPAPLQPGGVAAARDGSHVVVVGVRGRRIEAYAPDGRPLGSAPVGVGPTHVRAAPNGLFYVADTEGNAVIFFRVTASGPRQAGRRGPGAGHAVRDRHRRPARPGLRDADRDQPAGVLPDPGTSLVPAGPGPPSASPTTSPWTRPPAGYSWPAPPATSSSSLTPEAFHDRGSHAHRGFYWQPVLSVSLS